eukprot:s382_g9.t1
MKEIQQSICNLTAQFLVDTNRVLEVSSGLPLKHCLLVRVNQTNHVEEVLMEGVPSLYLLEIKHTGKYVRGWRKWSEQRSSWVAIYEFQGSTWRKTVNEEDAPRTKEHVDPLVIEYQVGCCHRPHPGFSDSESEADANAGFLGEEEEDNMFFMARDLKYHLQLTSAIVGMARQTDLCRCDYIIGRWDHGESSVDSMGRLCTEELRFPEEHRAQHPMSTGTSSSDPAGGGVRYFSGESEDYREYRRWKLWLVNKFQTLDKLPKEARGSYLFTCLSGKALETVEHVDPSTYQKDGGDTLLLKLLDARFPERDETDELAEVLNEVFNLRAREGESLRSWISRATELFDRCERKSGVKFPEEARGFMLLKWSGLNDEQQAVVKGRSLGILKREEISKAMRSCYPDFVVNRRKAVALVQDEQPLSPPSDSEVTGFDDIELFLADHDVSQQDDDALEFPENEVAEVLAASWKERRAEIAKLQKSRRFDQARDLRRSFRVEIEEMKKKTKCNRCGRTGHWARECRQRRDPQAPGSTSAPSRPSPKESAASYVASETVEQMPSAHFVASVSPQMTLLQQLKQKREQVMNVDPEAATPSHNEIFLVSSPGFAVLDSGCGKTIVGEKTLQQFQQLWSQDGRFFPEYRNETNVFKYGNGEREVSHRTVIMPIGLAGRYGTVQAAIVKGEAPLLLSRPALKRLGAVLDFHNDQIGLFSGAATIDLVSNSAGQYVLNVMDFPKPACKTEINMVSSEASCPQVEKMGFKGLSLDTSTGWDLDDPKQQEWVEAELEQYPPDLLVICPPCTNAGGWFHLNSLRMPVQEVLKRKLLLKKQKAFCKKLIRQQLTLGGRVLFEHPSPSSVWDDQDFINWCMQYHSFVTHMCCFDLHVPATAQHPKQLIRKSTRLFVSHSDMCVLRRNCPGDRDPAHVCHRQVAGSEPGIGRVSTHAGRYTPQFVSAVLNTVPKFRSPMEVLTCVEDSCVLPDPSVFEALAVVEETDPEKLKSILHKLHKNLGHPSNNDLGRILKHGQATDEAIKLVRNLTCSFCESRQPPAPANPGKASSVSEFNQRVGLDVKYLPGWRTNQKVPALNIIDHATSYQLVVPFFETETSSLLRRIYLERWVQWAGPPKRSSWIPLGPI